MSQIKLTEISDSDLYDALEKIEDRSTLLREINVNESLYSRWRSRPVSGEDNHRRGPFELINAMENYARSRLDKAREFQDEELIQSCEHALEMLGRWGAQKGKGVFLLRNAAKGIIAKIDEFRDELRSSFGMSIFLAL